MKIYENVKIQIPFSDVDSFNIIWYGNYFKYFEIARRKFLKKIKYDINDWKKTNCTWVIVETNCKYLKPLSYDKNINILCLLEEFKYRLKFSYKIMDNSNKINYAKGFTIQVPIDDKGLHSKIHQVELIEKINKYKTNEYTRKTKIRKK